MFLKASSQRVSGDKQKFLLMLSYWADQAGFLTPLTVTWLCLSPLGFLLPVCTFFTIEGGDSEFTKFTGLTLNAFLKARSQSVSGDQQELVARARGGHAFTIILSAGKRCRLPPPPPPPSPFLCNSCKHNNSGTVMLRPSRFNFHCYTQREPKHAPTQKSAWKWHMWSFATSCAKNCEGHSLVQTSFAELSSTAFSDPLRCGLCWVAEMIERHQPYIASFEYPQKWFQCCFLVAWLVPRKTDAISTHVLCTPYTHAPVYRVTLFEAIYK